MSLAVAPQPRDMPSTVRRAVNITLSARAAKPKPAKAPSPKRPPKPPDESQRLTVPANALSCFLWLAQLSPQVGGQYGHLRLTSSSNASYHSNSVSARCCSLLVPAHHLLGPCGSSRRPGDKRMMLVVTNIIRGLLVLAVSRGQQPADCSIC